MKDRPTFPSYHGPPLPQVLDPLAPRHYLMLLKWIWFQPSRLKHYLHNADADLYRALGPTEQMRSLRLPAYHHLYLISIILILGLTAGPGWIVSAAMGTALDWRGIVFGAAASLILGAALVILGGMAFGVASGPVFGVPFGVIFGGSFGVVFALASGVAATLTGSAGFGVAGGVAFGIALGVALAMAVGVTFGMAVGVALTTLLVVGLGIAFVVAFVVSGSEAVLVAFVVAVAAIAASGGSRLLFYPVEAFQARFLPRSDRDPFRALTRHPALWDELTVWPLPRTAHLLLTCLDRDFSRGLRLALRVAMSPFQRCTVQRALSDLLAERPDALAVVYHLAQVPMLNEYLVPPSRRHQFRSYRSARVVLIGEIGQQYLAASSEATENTEYLIWRFTRRWREMVPTPISELCILLYVLLQREAELKTTDPQAIRLGEQYESSYEGVRHLEHGVEIAGSFATIDAFLGTRTIDALATAHGQLAWTKELTGPGLRPKVIEALKALGDVSQEVSAYLRATNTGQKSAALNRAAGALNELAGYVKTEVLAPEHVLLERTVELWKSTVAAEQGRLGETALQEMAPAARRAAGLVPRTSSAWRRPAKPFDNPYIVGDPVYPPLLVGRKDVFDRIAEIWASKMNPDSIIVYGHRRMGKSSILRNLDQVAPQGSVVVYADMAGETSFVGSSADLLLGLADKIYSAVRRLYGDGAIPEPDPEAYAAQARAQFQLNRLLERVRETLSGRILVLALDEFEGVERAVEEGKIGREIYQFLRAKTQEPWLALVFGGLHTLDEMSRDYQQPFYGSYENIQVSYLSHQSAWRLITNPAQSFELNYEPEAIERVIAETGGQPYLVQQICRDAVDYLNHELFDLELEREVRITFDDVEAVLDDDFFRRGTVYFDGVWTQAGDREQRMLLRVMAGRDEPWAEDELSVATDLEPRGLHRQLRWAERHDILCRSEPDQWRFHVPLMRRWIRERG